MIELCTNAANCGRVTRMYDERPEVYITVHESPIGALATPTLAPGDVVPHSFGREREVYPRTFEL